MIEMVLKRPSTSTIEAHKPHPLDVAEGKAREAVENSTLLDNSQLARDEKTGFLLDQYGATLVCGKPIRSIQDIKYAFHGTPFSTEVAKHIMHWLMKAPALPYERDRDSERVKTKLVVMVSEDTHDRERVVITLGPDPRDPSKLFFKYDTHPLTEYRIKVRAYMTKPSEEGSDFKLMETWNQNTPMPMRVMVGRILEETKGMYRMALHGRPEPSDVCLHCGRTLTHPVSLLYGIGPVCGQHFHINPLGSPEALAAAYESIKATLEAVTWTGWIPKSAIQEMMEVEA